MLKRYATGSGETLGAGPGKPGSVVVLLPRTRLAALRTLALSILLVLAAFAADRLGPEATFMLTPESISHDEGDAYVARVPVKRQLVFEARGDRSSSPERSTLVLIEDGRPLEPAHALHATVRERGGGAYSHWGRDVIFSTPDGSDPRANGRTYGGRVLLALSGRVWNAVGVLVFLSFVGWFRVQGTAPIAALARPWRPGREAVGTLWAVALAVGFALAALGWDWRYGGAGQLSVAGHLPVSDAHGYWICGSELAGAGAFLSYPDWCTRRVLYPSFLAGLLTVSDWHLPHGLIAQTALVALALLALARELARLMGVLPALVALVFTLGYAWTYAVGTTMTEALGLAAAGAALVGFALVVLVLWPHTVAVNAARWSPRDAVSCADEERPVVVRPGRETIGMEVVADAALARPFEGAVPVDVVREDVRPTWYRDELSRLDPGMVAVQAIQRHPDGFGRALHLILPGDVWRRGGEYLELCMSTTRSLPLAEVPYFLARSAP